MYGHTAFWKARKLLKSQNAWASEYSDFAKVLRTRGG